jgi:hypothetical protein
LPHLIDDAAIDLFENTVKDKLENLSQNEFITSKKKNFDTIAESRLDLSKISQRYFNSIVESNYKSFDNFVNMEKYSRSILKEDLISFFKNVFLENNLKFTVYVSDIII